jgi:hypothetical protein
MQNWKYMGINYLNVTTKANRYASLIKSSHLFLVGIAQMIVLSTKIHVQTNVGHLFLFFIFVR